MKHETVTLIPDKKAYYRDRIIEILPALADKDFTMVLSSSLTVADSRPQTGYCALVEDKLYIIEDGKHKDTLDLSRTREFHADSGIGQVALECMLDGETYIICRGDMSHQSEYATLAKRLNKYLEQQVFEKEYDKTHNRSCPQCGRQLQHGSHICMHCVDKSRIFKRLWEIARPYKWTLLASIVLFFLITGMNMINPILNRILVDDYITPHNAGGFRGFALVILSMFVLHIVVNATSILRSIALIFAGNKIIVHLRDMVFNKVQMLSVSKISKRTAGEIMQRVTQDTGEIQNFVVHRLSNIIEQSLILIGVSIMLFMTDWRLALMILVPIPLVSMSFRFFWRYTHRLYHRQ
ncbi:MAG: hypothetical protein MJ175_07565, partial [Clostridia bacterium]|nr:hypothetical protein [Clostridia bacterium]